MKNIVAIIWMCLLAANISGLSITHHVCGKKLQYISFSGKKKGSHCCCKGEPADRGCCKTNFIKVKMGDDKSHAKQLIINPKPLFATLLQRPMWPIMQRAHYIASAYTVPRIHPPPLLLAVRKHLLNSLFLI